MSPVNNAEFTEFKICNPLSDGIYNFIFQGVILKSDMVSFIVIKLCVINGAGRYFCLFS
jgi:hypothetical protein